VSKEPEIQLPYYNRFETIWEYEKAFLSGEIDFVSFIGVRCPICESENCYRAITPYWRYAIELFPEFEKRRIPVARFLCRRRRKTFSLLPIQLIPYFQYTVGAVVGTLLLGMGYWQMGQKGFYGASLGVDPESLVTPWLITCWLVAVLGSVRRAQGFLREFYNLEGIRASETWEELAAYFLAFGLSIRVGTTVEPTPSHGSPKKDWFSLLMELIYRYSQRTGQFIFGRASQYRRSFHR